ncbi:MAG: hypothetical protein KKA55_09740, partial [Proteobacteria bacterium]|nr:hypothetical protein [Pseudomonadota bacterium]
MRIPELLLPAGDMESLATALLYGADAVYLGADGPNLRARAAGFAEGVGADSAMVVNRGKTMLLARRGTRPLSEGFRLVGSHVDTPRIDFKQHPLYEDMDIALAKTHYYGGIRKYQWLARPLALHGVAVKKDGGIVRVVLGEDPADPVLTITDLLPHLAYKEVVKKVEDAFEAEKL